jgi:hypothetical protein
VNVQHGCKGRSLTRLTKALDTVGMDICYGDGVSPGGYSYCLMLIDRATRKTWVYGIPDMNVQTLSDALWKSFVDAGLAPLLVLGCAGSGPAPIPDVTIDGAPITVLTTTHELFYGIKPDLSILFPFGAIGYYHRPSDGGSEESLKVKPSRGSPWDGQTTPTE